LTGGAKQIFAPPTREIIFHFALLKNICTFNLCFSVVDSLTVSKSALGKAAKR
jgi:hypothetical protein